MKQTILFLATAFCVLNLCAQTQDIHLKLKREIIPQDMVMQPMPGMPDHLKNKYTPPKALEKHLKEDSCVCLWTYYLLPQEDTLGLVTIMNKDRIIVYADCNLNRNFDDDPVYTLSKEWFHADPTQNLYHTDDCNILLKKPYSSNKTLSDPDCVLVVSLLSKAFGSDNNAVRIGNCSYRVATFDVDGVSYKLQLAWDPSWYPNYYKIFSVYKAEADGEWHNTDQKDGRYNDLIFAGEKKYHLTINRKEKTAILKLVGKEMTK
jgi:hypothetical protein